MYPGLFPLFAQSEIQLKDIECYNLGDGRYYCRYMVSEKPVQGNARIIDGRTTQYIDATFSDGIPHGSWKTYRYNKLVEEFNYNNGILDGVSKKYYPDGSVKEVRNYANGKPHGKFTDYNAKGRVEREINFKNGKQDGPEIMYDSEGKVRSRTNYTAGKTTGAKVQEFDDYTLTANYDGNGELDGKYSEIFNNGNVKRKGKYIHGKKEGVWETGRKDGKKMTTEEYEAGDKVKETTYYTDNTVEFVRELRNGKKNGWERKYNYGDGSLKSELFYKDGEASSPAGTNEPGQSGDKQGLVKQNQTKQISNNIGSYIQTFYQSNGRYEGEYTEHYVNGNAMKTKGQYVDGKKEGKWVYETKDGKPEREENYTAGKLNGLVIKYSNGLIRESVEHRNDSPNGEFKRYDRDGKLTQKGMYEDGRLHGVVEEYYPNGKLKERNIYKRGSYDGVRQEFYSNGQMQLEQTYVDGYKVGPYKEWTETGQLSKEGEAARSGIIFEKTYRNGKLEKHEYRPEDSRINKVDYYDENGKKR
jgi:antitoxin component YwqK of YwqJK toxin-antitoxin module